MGGTPFPSGHRCDPAGPHKSDISVRGTTGKIVIAIALHQDFPTRAAIAYQPVIAYSLESLITTQNSTLELQLE